MNGCDIISAMKHVMTEDGSSTLYSDEYGDHYHSVKGAIQESTHIFIQRGLLETKNDPLQIFEMGFGTGLNALLTCLHGGERKIRYTSIERHPLDLETAGQLNYTGQIEDPRAYDVFLKLHLASWNDVCRMSDNFELYKVEGNIEEFQTEEKFDLVYFDAFAPDAQPDLWTEDMFAKISAMCCNGALLLTYSAKGAVRRALEKSGFAVERLAGPPGKREILRARKS